MNFIERLQAVSLERGNLACLGLDPDLNRIPLEGSVFERLVGFYLEILKEMIRREVLPAMVKPNVAYFEQYGLDGYRALDKIIAEYREAGLMVLLDAKRGDIDRTNEAYARAVFENLQCDAVTVNPYMGVESLKPFLRYLSEGRGVYILARTSNPGAQDFQEQLIEGEALFERVVRMFMEAGHSGLGFVMGGTSPACLKKILEQVASYRKPAALLIPGFGTQGASAAEVRSLFREYPSSQYFHRMNSSSSINYAWQSNPARASKYAEASVDALQSFIEQCCV